MNERWASAVRGVLEMEGWSTVNGAEFFKGEGTFLARARLGETAFPIIGTAFGLQISDIAEKWEVTFSAGTPTEAIRPTLKLAVTEDND